MPELPEIEILRRDLDREIGDRKVKSVEIPGAGLVKYPRKQLVASTLVGVKLGPVTRRGLVVSIGAGDDHVMLLTLGEQTRLSRNQPKDAAATGTAMVITFTQGGQLRLVDPKKQATLELVTQEELAERHPEFLTFGLDPVDEPIAWTDFAGRILRREGKLKAVLMIPKDSL